MKKFMRFAMVLALAGSALLYSGCTKDYQQSIDDLNSKVNTLNSDVTLLKEYVSKLQDVVNTLTGTEVPAIKERITNCENLIKALQEGSATKAEVEALKEAINKDLLALSAKVGANQEAIAALTAAFQLMNVGKVQSVTLVPTYYDYEYFEIFNLSVGDEFPETLIETEPMLFLRYAVRPTVDVALFTEENSALHVITSVGDAYFPVEILDADPETGDIYLKVEIPAEYQKTTVLKDGYVYPFSYEIADATNGLLNNIKSPFNFGYYYTGYTTNLKYMLYNEETGKTVGRALPGIEVPWDQFATSERTFFSGYKYGLYDASYGYYKFTLEQAAALFGVDEKDITPEVKTTITADNKDYIVTDATVPSAKMKAAKAEDAVKALDKSETATAKAYFTLDYVPFVVLENTQTYTVVETTAEKAVIDAVNFHWVGDATTPAKTFNNLKISAKLPQIITLTAMSADGKKAYGEIKATPDEDLVTVDFPAELLPFADKAQTFVATGSYTDKGIIYPVEMTITLDPMPADKELDLGTFTTNGSASHDVKVALPIVKALVNGDEALYANFATNPLYATIAGKFKSYEFTKVIVTYADGSVKKLPQDSYTAMFPMTFDYDDKKSEDNTAMNLPAGVAAYGATYTFWGETEAYGVDYDFTFQIAVNPADFSLVTTPVVSEGNIINAYAEIVEGKGPKATTKYTINDVYFSDYFEISKVVDDELFVKFSFDYEIADAKTKAYYAGKAKWDNTKTIEPSDVFTVAVNEASKTLVRDNNYLNWNTYVGRQIFGKAVLGYYAKGEFVPAGSAIDFTLVTPDPVKSFTAKAINNPAKVYREAGKNVTVKLADSLVIKSQINEITILPDAKVKKDGKEHKYSWYDLNVGVATDKGAFSAALPASITGKLNGQEFTFIKGTHYTVDDKNLEITFLANNAYGDIEFTLPMAITHIYGYGIVEHTADLSVTIPQKKQ